MTVRAAASSADCPPPPAATPGVGAGSAIAASTTAAANAAEATTAGAGEFDFGDCGGCTTVLERRDGGYVRRVLRDELCRGCSLCRGN